MIRLFYCFGFGLLWFAGLALFLHIWANRHGNPFKRKESTWKSDKKS